MSRRPHLEILRHRPLTRDGWQLDIRQYRDRRHHDPTKMPLLFVPGYCMNTFILQFHPGATPSMVEYLCHQGHEVFTANLRGQGGSRRRGGSRRYGFRQLSLIDLPLALEVARHEGRARNPRRLAAVGCSLGATVIYGYLAHHRAPADHGLGALIAVGGPLRWDHAHPLLELLFASPRLAASLPIVGTRHLARLALPVASRLPFLMQLYMNTDQVDLRQANQLVKTIDDPNPWLNLQIAHWVRDRDLVVAGVDVTRAMAKVHDLPLLCILANRDGVVPPRAALSITDHLGSDDVEILVAGDDDRWYAHADLFIAHGAEERVFAPMADWLAARSRTSEHPDRNVGSGKF